MATFKVDGVYSMEEGIAMAGTVLNGRIGEGMIFEDGSIKASVSRGELFNKRVPVAKTGDRAGLILEGAKFEDLKKYEGGIIEFKGEINSAPLSTSEQIESGTKKAKWIIGVIIILIFLITFIL